MRPLTLGRLFLRCGILAVVLFVVVVIALKLGAVQVSLYGLGRDLIRVLLHQSSSISTDYGMIVVDIRLPRIFLAVVVGASLRCRHCVSSALAQPPRRSVCARHFQRCGRRRHHCSNGGEPAFLVAGICRTHHSLWRIHRGRGHHRCGLCPWPPGRSDR